jgi:hypothetical protein
MTIEQGLQYAENSTLEDFIAIAQKMAFHVHFQVSNFLGSRIPETRIASK